MQKKSIEEVEMRTSNKGGCKSIVPALKVNIRKASAQMKLKIGRDILGNRKRFHKNVQNKSLEKILVHRQMGKNNLMTTDTEMTKTLHAFFASVFTAKACSQTPHTPVQSGKQRGSR